MNEPSPPLPNRTTIVEAMARHAAERPDAIAFRFVGRHAHEARELSWQELVQGVLRLAALFEKQSLKGQPIAIICPDPRDFVVAIMACFWAGAIAVPVPAVATRRSAERIKSVVEASEPKAIVGTAATLAQPWIAALAESGTIKAVDLDQALQFDGCDAACADSYVKPSSPALMQFTSGSTGAPRGVLLTHANIAANCAAVRDAYQLDSNSRFFSWLPLHHDMGLVGHVLIPLLIGSRSTLWSPLLFLQSPLRWLRHMTEERSTITSAPNFAYELCVKAACDATLDGIELSSLTAAVCGGESVWPDTIERFCSTFEPCGFMRRAFAPSYGLAEATLLVSSGIGLEGPRTFSGLVQNPEGSNGSHAQYVHAASLGPPALGLKIRTVDGTGSLCGERVIGEIEVSGSSVGRLVGSDKPRGQILTGDLGFIDDGELYVVGRRKEVIILRGQNVYPCDIEAAALKAHSAIRPGAVAAVAVRQDGTESLLLVVEAERAICEEECVLLCRRVNEAVARATGHTPWQTLAVPAGALKRTTSGKLQRGLIADMFMRGDLRPLTPPRPREAEEFDA